MEMKGKFYFPSFFKKCNVSTFFSDFKPNCLSIFRSYSQFFLDFDSP